MIQKGFMHIYVITLVTRRSTDLYDPKSVTLLTRGPTDLYDPKSLMLLTWGPE